MSPTRPGAERWTTPADVVAAVRRRWEDGSLLQALAAGGAFPVLDLPVRRPGASRIGDDLSAVRRWAEGLAAGARPGRRGGGPRYEVVYGDIGGRSVGRNRIPERIRVTGWEQAWALLDVAAEVAAYEQLLALVADEPAVRAWVAANPLRALAVREDWSALVAAYRWLVGARGSGRYLREISAPGVDTKLVERHRGLLATLLGVSATPGSFVTDLGLAAKPERVRLRFAPGTVSGLGPLSEATVRVDELARAEVHVERAVVVENEITFLSVPLPVDGIVVWGRGFEVDRIGAVPWLGDAAVDYWGDLDTHGFAILHRLRAWLPQTRSFLMDRETLLAHRDRWGREGSPTTARLDRLTTAELALYTDLVGDRFGEAVRLEQERIDWAWALDHLPYPPLVAATR